MKKILGILVISLLILSSFEMMAEDAKEIAYKVYNRKAPKDGESDMKMTLIDKRGDERVRDIRQFFIDLGDIEKQIMFFTSPADVRNTAFMNWSYEEAGKDDNQWLYLPALKKVKRISSSGKDNEFMGSDFTYEDMEKRNPERDNHKFIKNEKIEGEEMWVVESTPKKEEQYSKKRAWISKERELPKKIEFYDEDGELLKILTVLEVKKVKGYWIIVKQEMKNIQKKHRTLIELSNMKVDIGLKDDRFSERTMRRGL